jgi:uncharacterized ubiquitin-like protein YukD
MAILPNITLPDASIPDIDTDKINVKLPTVDIQSAIDNFPGLDLSASSALDTFKVCGLDVDKAAVKGVLLAAAAYALSNSNALASLKSQAGTMVQNEMEQAIREFIQPVYDVRDSDGEPIMQQVIALAVMAEQFQKNPEDVINQQLIQVYNDNLADFQTVYGDALKKAGVSVNGMIDGILDNIDPCALVPNILMKPDGTVGENPKEPLFAKDQSEPEEPSEETAIMKALKSQTFNDLNFTRVVAASARTLTEESLEQVKTLGPDAKTTQSTKQTIVEYWDNIKSIEDIDRSILKSRPMTSPTIEKIKMENVRQGTEIPLPPPLSQSVLPEVSAEDKIAFAASQKTENEMVLYNEENQRNFAMYLINNPHLDNMTTGDQYAHWENDELADPMYVAWVDWNI